MEQTRAASHRRRYLWWRYLGRHISGLLDRLAERRHLVRYGWPLRLGMGPFSRPEQSWHDCAGHEWERIDWPYGRHVKRGHRPDTITRCRACGAPRCDSYDAEWTVLVGLGPWATLTDREEQGVRCTLERHHSEAHDFLTGRQIAVGE